MIEQYKYQQVWNHPKYREMAPGEHIAETFLQVANPKVGETVIDFGCGTGRGGAKLADVGLSVRLLDFTDNCLDEAVRARLNGTIQFVQHDLTQPFGGMEKYGFCTDVMEHIPTDDVEKVLRNILYSARHVFFQISCEPDNLGALIGEQLHLTVKPYAWWLEKFNKLHCTVHWSHDAVHTCLFYVTAWANGKDFHSNARVNTEDEAIRANVLANLEFGLTEIRPFDPQDKEIMLVCGGPSLKDHLGEIKLARKLGMSLVTVNGAYNWCLENNIQPSLQIVLDAREFNKRFVQPSIPTCKYLLASQCHPETVKAAPQEQVILWHSGSSEAVKSAIEEFDAKRGEGRNWYPVYGGMTVMLRAFPLLLMLGFSKFQVYGFDSCLSENQHHAYPQPENDRESVIDVNCGGRVFKCHPWMLTQAHEFIEMTKIMLGDTCQMEIHGDGLIAHIVKTGAEIGRNERIHS